MGSFVLAVSWVFIGFHEFHEMLNTAVIHGNSGILVIKNLALLTNHGF